MTDRPIDIPASRIPALLDGRMTQYRTPLKPQPVPRSYYQNKITTLPERNELFAWFGRQWEGPYRIALPHAIGDRLWVREDWRACRQMDGIEPSDMSQYEPRGMEADGALIEPACFMIAPGRLRPSITMPRWASRITLTVTDLAVHRVQEISEADARAEGVCDPEWLPAGNDLGRARRCLESTYNATHGNGAWDRNDWVLARTFRVHLCNIDQMEEADG